MFSATLNTWISLVAAVGAGTIIASMVGWWSAKAVAISNHRQGWINALRDDLVLYLKEIDTLHDRVASLQRDIRPESLERHQETGYAALLVYRRILLRLNMTEQPHIQLAEALKQLLVVKGSTAESRRVDNVVVLARQVLKHEWAVTKYGIFTGLVVGYKTRQREMIGTSDPLT